MPIYEFVCELCGRLVERIQKVSDPPPDACPECGGKMAKIMSRSSFQLKGGGWYSDLYSSTTPKKEGSSTSSSSGSSAPGSSSGGESKPSGESSKPAEKPAAAPASSSPKSD